jgi:pumilio family protein 6
MVHAEGSAVLQLLYSDVASGEQKNGLFRALWAKEVAMLGASASSQFGSLEQLFELDPLCKGRVLRRLEILLSKAARKGLAVTSLVQRGAAEMLAHGDDAQRQELVNTFKEQAVHIMHTRDGARIACGCLRHGDAKDRKALLKALKGYVGRAACDPHGALVLCVALEAVDDTVLLAKGVLTELTSSLDTLSRHPHGTLPLQTAASHARALASGVPTPSLA